jgi:tRNA pseudouridine38-40 synthase
VPRRPSTVAPEPAAASAAAGPREVSVKLTLEYDGTRFHGWAIQPGKRTVAGELQAALETLLRRPVELTVAGRTDRGVHARGQVVSYDGPPPPLRNLNALLPHDVAVLAAEPAPPGFNARLDARSRSYLYRVHTRRWGPSPFEVGRALWWPHRVDLGALQACAAAIAGEHDFTAFTPSGGYHRRFERVVLAASWAAGGEQTLEFHIEADAFMRHMIRVLVGTMLEVAGDRRTLEDFTALLAGAPRSAAGPTAPAHGLYFLGARYPG